MKIDTPHQLPMPEATKEIVDLLIGDFIHRQCMGRNDMAVVTALLTTAGMLVAAHCDSVPGHDVKELTAAGHEIFGLAVELAGKGE